VPADLRDPQEALRVALAVNEDTGREDSDLLTTLALAYHQTGQQDQAVATQRAALEKIPENLFFPRTNNENRLTIYEGRTRDDADLGLLLPGVWTGQVGPVSLRAEVVRDGEHLVGINRADLPFIPKDQPWFRVRPANGEAELCVYDSGGTNPRWEPGQLRVTDDGSLLVWHQEQWFVVRLRKS